MDTYTHTTLRPPPHDQGEERGDHDQREEGGGHILNGEQSFHSPPVIMFYDGNVTSYIVSGCHGDMYPVPSPLHPCILIIDRYSV